jgi:hypothetical protein
MGEPLKWYDEKEDNPPWIDALAEVRRYQREHDRHRTVSLDEPLYDASPISLIDRIAAADWQSDFHTHDTQ